MQKQISSLIPWWVKICAKVVLARLPFGYGLWRRFGLFRHGKMDQVTYVCNVFNQHMGYVGFANQLNGKSILELGPGDSIATAIIAACHGAHAVLVDTGNYAIQDVATYQRFSKALREQGFNPPDITNSKNIEDILNKCEAKYLSCGLTSLKNLPDNSIDIIFSHAVLEHIRCNEFFETMQECYRVLRPEGVASHSIDLKDHLGGNLNNLRFKESIWESSFFVRSGFYTNRIRFSEMLAIMQNAGFRTEKICPNRWYKSPISRKNLSSDFVNLTDDDLLVNGFTVLLRLA